MSAANVNLITAVAAANPNTIVVINNDNPVDTSWIGSAKSILEMWFAGQEGGTSTARILLGLANPSGHTALTWPANRTDTIWGYNEPRRRAVSGLDRRAAPRAAQRQRRLRRNRQPRLARLPGRRRHERVRGHLHRLPLLRQARASRPRFPFGWGLSYTSFAFSQASPGARRDDATADGGRDVHGEEHRHSVAGADAVQVYVGPPSDSPAPGVQFAVRSLAQFARVMVPAKSAGWPFTTVTMHVSPRALSHWSEADQRWVRDPGIRTIYAGDADTPSRLLSMSITVPAAPGSGAFECKNTEFNGTKITGDVKVPDGSWCDLSAVAVSGNVMVGSTTGLRVRNSTIGGKLLVTGASAAANPQASGTNLICGNTITGNLQVGTSTAASGWNIGGVCGGNTVGGDLQFNNNAGAGTITGNTITGSLKCQGNAPAPVPGKPNTAASKQGQCSTGF